MVIYLLKKKKMVESEVHIRKLKEFDYPFEKNLADHVKRKGHSLSHTLFIKAVLLKEIRRDNDPLVNMEILHDMYEIGILGHLVDNIRTYYYLNTTTDYSLLRA